MNDGHWKFIHRYPLAVYFAIAYLWTWLCWWLVVAGAHWKFESPFPAVVLETLGQFGPFVASVFVLSATEGRGGLREFLVRLVRWRANPIWLAVALFLIPGTMMLAIYCSFLLGSVSELHFRDALSTWPLHFVYLMILGGPLGEEPGWRGFALPRLQASYGAVMGSVCLGFLHAGWHLPLWWIHRPPCPFWMYVIGVVLVTFLFTWLFNHTNGSVLYSLIFHSSMSIASVRLPEAPAYHLWMLVLLPIVLLVLVFDPHLGQSRSEMSPDAATAARTR